VSLPGQKVQAGRPALRGRSVAITRANRYVVDAADLVPTIRFIRGAWSVLFRSQSEANETCVNATQLSANETQDAMNSLAKQARIDSGFFLRRLCESIHNHRLQSRPQSLRP
jgi:hypothetical protein